MFAVIFRAKVKELDQQYSEMAAKLRDIAMNEFGCTDFISLTEGDQEIAVSYWPSEENIKNWKQHSDHLIAQSFGKKKWYSHYQVEVVEIKRSYASA
ncbi:antibiotic biosynthesis monooxygenase family protein [Litoribrevibacter albus]|uniref:Polysaccharide biosynthesis protein n=1 Tax=Litoribrevibacter albus TaxID=1473156 RepID=A0AA37S5V9_9GAMM|nr:antibiotic biosynthesis monooxygenase [Litoribrevibacter albus]GLQ29856.1 polysaccharide biosynthesis protein [Litoribrevibacter albus]